MVALLKQAPAAITGALVGAAVVFLLMEMIFLPRARIEGRDAERAAVAQATLDATKERVKDDAKLQRLGAYDLCVEYLGRVPECERLWAVRGE
ncbi:hypothetical protein V6767_20015 [Martelella sp. FLE1502]